jgi:hypothetical protein
MNNKKSWGEAMQGQYDDGIAVRSRCAAWRLK